MSRIRRWWLAGLLAALAHAQEPAALADGGLAIEPLAQTPRFGEPFAVAMVVEWPATAATAAAAPDLDFTAWPQLTLVETGRRAVAARGPERRAERRTFTATAWQAGELVLPPLPLAVVQGGRRVPLPASAPWRLAVASGLGEPAGEVEWPGDVRDLPSRSARWLLAGLALVATAAFAARRRARPAAAVPPAAAPAPRPGAAFAAELAALGLPSPAASASVQQWHVALADLLGRAQAARSGLPTAAWTTAERLGHAGPAAGPLQQCLPACDLVKFAAARPDAAALAAAAAAARAALAAWWPEAEAA